MDEPSLNALRAFDAVARLSSVAAAATELVVTPSAVSRQISNLEEALGVPLLTRSGRHVRLTVDGHRLANGLEDAFAQIASAVDRLRQTSHYDKLRILVPPMFASSWLIPRLDNFSAGHPGIDVILIDKAERVRVAKNADMVIGWGRYEDDAMTVAERLTDSEKIFPVCRREVCQDDNLAGATLLHRENIENAWKWPDWSTFLKVIGLDAADTVDGPHLAAGLLLDAVRQGKGVLLISTTVAHDELASGRLVRPIVQSMSVDDSFWLLIPRTELNRPEVVAFRIWIKGEIASKRGKSWDEAA